ncbi:MAG: RluA family pseudouridine synthase [Candidatus Magasanikbacteria bacterium]|nr:RluA family pseudouridine synthase [Candidatus Magasanikbacteria bacterium]MCA9389460.1 RluA family pseudouridine synthase [Candidatus Magasanikbacteria bacterium]USN52857.1 MAG: RluA family pseudouridine synthase [Candidatus Nomurabacteria bacterium]
MSYPIEVLYEDNHLIAVVKPPGALIQADESDERCLMDDVKDYLKSKYQKPGNVFLGLIHRLDRNVTGIVVFAKTSKGASRLSEQFRKRDITKTYHALVEGHLERPHGTLINMLDKEEHKRIAYESPKGKEAKLSYKVIKELGENTLVEIELYTGRFHQIRAQFGLINHPLVGDYKYGADTTLPNQEIALAATKLAFQTATGEKEVVLEIPIPTWHPTKE